uniref:Uncharacterized protein n=1 Tax=Panagrolaimus sp. JU765 TaxID=591449 RepID=A0AC34QTJ0_9BILA
MAQKLWDPPIIIEYQVEKREESSPSTDSEPSDADTIGSQNNNWAEDGSIGDNDFIYDCLKTMKLLSWTLNWKTTKTSKPKNCQKRLPNRHHSGIELMGDDEPPIPFKVISVKVKKVKE